MSEELKTIDTTETVSVEPEAVIPEPAAETVSETKNTTNETPETEPEEEKKSSKGFFSRFKKNDWTDSRDGWILTHLQQDEIMEYLRMEHERETLYFQEKEARNKRIMIGFMTTICLLAGVLLVYLLKDNPTILITILYIGGLLLFLRYWKKPEDK